MGITVHTLQALREGKEDLHPRPSSPGRKHCRQRPTEHRRRRSGASPQCHLVAESCIAWGPTPRVFSPWMCAKARGRQRFLSGLTSCQTHSDDCLNHTWPHQARPSLTLVYCVLSDVSYILRFHARWETIMNLWEERRSRERSLRQTCAAASKWIHIFETAHEKLRESMEDWNCQNKGIKRLLHA